jgi:hypothetical protein
MLTLFPYWGERSDRGEPGGIPSELSQVLAKVFRSICDEGGTAATIANELGITTEELHAHVFGLSDTLRAVVVAGSPRDSESSLRSRE